MSILPVQSLASIHIYRKKKIASNNSSGKCAIAIYSIVFTTYYSHILCCMYGVKFLFNLKAKNVMQMNFSLLTKKKKKARSRHKRSRVARHNLISGLFSNSILRKVIVLAAIYILKFITLSFLCKKHLNSTTTTRKKLPSI